MLHNSGLQPTYPEPFGANPADLLKKIDTLKLEYKEETSSYIIIFIIAFVIGLLTSYLCKEFVPLSFILMGFATGYFMSEYLLTIFDFSGEKVI